MGRTPNPYKYLLIYALITISLLLCISPLLAATCGDGTIDEIEECDDGNLDNGDGCDLNCTVELGYTCTEASFKIDYFEDWSAQGFLPGPTTWTLSADQLTVSQRQNSGPGVAMTNLPAVDLNIQFEMQVQSGGDDDFIGWTVGYEYGDHSNPNAEYMIFDWKKGNQLCGTYAHMGMAMSRITGIPTLSGGCSSMGNFWGHSGAMVEEARAVTLGYTGWAAYVTYLVEVEYHTDHIRIWIDGILQFDEYGNFPVGNFGFYTNSQANDRFTLVSPVGTASACGLDPDADPDNDGVPSGDDPAPWDTEICGDWDNDNLDDCAILDSDNDGVLDDEDNCPGTPNLDQYDFDTDGIGNACDPDIDGDGVDNYRDNCTYDYNPGQSDYDSDGAGDACDADLDDDGVIDADDACLPTSIGDTVDEIGCSLNQLCPCNNPWNNHGSFMKCVAHKSKNFVEQGLITEDEKHAFVSAAARSACGKKK